jgi:HPt (histidine-containing phosphotransfer) domain-containing protein
MSPGQGTIEALLAAARSEYAASAMGKVAHLEGLVAQAAWGEARRAAHKLRGSAATYGFVALGVAAGAIEDLLLGAGEPAAGPGATGARLAQLLVDLATEAKRAAGGAA